jgi:glyoxalase-like protein
MKLIECITFAACILISGWHPVPNKETPILSRIDHLVYAAPNLAAGVEQVEKLLGVKAVPGGQHPGAGTRNALIRLGELTYLEIIGPDPDQPEPAQPRRFGIDQLKAPRLVTWAAKGEDLEALITNAKSKGIDLGQVQSGSRRRPDGVLLSWRLTVSPALNADGIVPFFIDWGATPHPAASLPKGCTLISLRAEHPNAKRVRAMLVGIGLNLPGEAGAAAALIALVRTPQGDVELR